MSKVKDRIVSELYDCTFMNDFKSDESLSKCANLLLEIICEDIYQFIKNNPNIKNDFIYNKEIFNYLIKLKEEK